MDQRSLGAGRRAAGYGSGVHRIDVDAHTWDPVALAQRVEAIFTSPTYTPPALPQVAMEVMALSRRQDVDMEQVAALLNRDPVLVGRMIKVASSAAFRGTAPLRTMSQALSRLGLATMRDLLMADALALKVFRTGGGYAGSLDELRVHSIMTAHLARLVCKRTSIDSEYAFLCGMLHDIGFAAILLAMGNVDRGQLPPSLDVLWPVADEAHARVGATLARLWKFPDDVVLVIERHHRPLIDGRLHPVAAAMQVAEQLAFENGVALLPKLPDGTVLMDIDAPSDIEVARARAALRIDDALMDHLRAEAEPLVASLN